MANAAISEASASDLLWSSFNDVNGVPGKLLGRSSWVAMPRGRSSSVKVLAKPRGKKKVERPWPSDPSKIDPNVKGGILSYLSSFKPLKEARKPYILKFEKPFNDLQEKIIDVKNMASKKGVDFSDQIGILEAKYQKARESYYANLTPMQRVTIARHPHRPTFLDHIMNITDKWFELHGDRAGYDDPAIVTGLGSMEGKTYMFIGHQKGRTSKENVQRNFGMPTPHGYRKALRLMYYADHYGFPIITFIDTPGAFADLKSEQLGQGEAIAQNLRTMFGLKVPIVSIVIGEGGSGGALAIGCANKLLMLENSVFYVASVEAAAAILWKTAKAAPKAAKRLKITATELCKLKVADGIIQESLGGAHVDPAFTSQQIKTAILEAMNELSEMDTPTLLNHRKMKFRIIGDVAEPKHLDQMRTRNMKESELPRAQLEAQDNIASELSLETESLKDQILKSKDVSLSQSRDSGVDNAVVRLKKEVDHEMNEAVKSMGLLDKLQDLRKQFASASARGQKVDPGLLEKIKKLRQEIHQGLSENSNFASIQYKIDMMKEIVKAQVISERSEQVNSVKQEINDRLMDVMNEPELKGKVEKLKLEIENSGVSKASDLDDGLNEKISKLKMDLESEMAKALDALNLSIELAAPNESAAARELQLDAELKNEIEEFDGEIKDKIEEAIMSAGLKRKMELLKFEIKKAAGKPLDKETAIKIEAMKQQIKQAIADDMDSLSLAEKHDKLKHEIGRRLASASGASGATKNG